MFCPSSVPYVSTCLKYPGEIRPYIHAANVLKDSLKDVGKNPRATEGFPDGVSGRILFAYEHTFFHGRSLLVRH
jgi:hypothetical protein